jgi:VanZ family protein
MSFKLVLRIAGLFGIFVIVLLSVIPADLQIRTSASKGFEHMAAYLLVGFVLAAAYGRHRGSAPIILILLIAVSGALEIIQQWCPGRTPSLADWSAGAFGAFVGVLLHAALRELQEGFQRKERLRHASAIAAGASASRMQDAGTTKRRPHS